MWRIKLGLLIVGGVLIFIAGKELMLASKTSKVASKMTCIQLINDGPGDNVFITLREFVPCMNWFVYKTTSDKKDPDGPYEVVYLPAVEFGGQWHTKAIELYQMYGENAQFPAPQNVKVLLKIKDVKNNRELDKIVNREKLKGMVINSVESIGSKEKSLLRQGYPNLDVDGCYIFEVGRKPASVTTQVSILITGVILFLAGLFVILILPRMEKRKAAKIAADNASKPKIGQNLSDQKPIQQESMHLQDDHDNPYA